MKLAKRQVQILSNERRWPRHCSWPSAKTTNRPAFQRLIRDIELGRTDTVMFTDLSRLPRSLKDFLNIFEFAHRHACDLVCLKTEIDTTSPYQGFRKHCKPE